MYKLIRLFSLLFILLTILSSEIKREFDIKVEFVSTIIEEKPRILPPDKLPYPVGKPLDLSPMLIEAPKSIELANIEPIKDRSTLSCGEPKDAIAYRLGVDYYLKGEYDKAKKELESVIVAPSSFKPMAEYILGTIYAKQGKPSEALPLFASSCKFSHLYSKAACEAYYALNFMLKGNIPENNDPLWKSVKALTLGEYIKPSCKDAIFSNYCNYVLDFYNGEVNEAYSISTKLRRGIKLFQEGNLAEAERIFIDYNVPRNAYREIALYYLGIIELYRDNLDRGLYYTGILETINRDLAKNLYNLLAGKGVAYSRLAFSATKDPSFLEKAGIIAYNSGQYNLALSNFIEARSDMYVAYSAIKLGDYKKAYQILEKKKSKGKEEYIWMLESAYWLGYDLAPILSEIKSIHPDLYKEYLGWDHFRRGEWEKAAQLLERPYYKAISLYNDKKYPQVLQVLKDENDTASRILKARSALFLGNPKLARTFLDETSDDELYLIGLSFFVEGSYQRAIEYFEKISYNSPQKPKALLKVADAFYNLGNWERAKETYYEVLRKYTDTQYAEQATVLLIGLGGRALTHEELEQLILQAISKEKDQSLVGELKYQLGNIYINMGKNEKAKEVLLDLLDTPLENKAVLKLAQIEPDTRRKAVLLYKVYREGTNEEREIAREKLIELFSSSGDERSLAELLYEGSLDQKAKAVTIFIKLGEEGRAREILNNLLSLGYRTDELENALLEVLGKSRDRTYIDYLLKSPNNETRAKALYWSAIDYLEKGERKKAMEDILDIVTNHPNSSVYNRAVLQGVEILLSLNAKRDASCFLERYDLKAASQEEFRKIQDLRKGLPKCGGK